jgi:hypothetical protein
MGQTMTILTYQVAKILNFELSVRGSEVLGSDVQFQRITVLKENHRWATHPTKPV